MAHRRLPNVRVISTPVSNLILLTGIGSRLRSHYEDLLYRPMPDRIDKALRRLS
jgi:hypothetical protein